MFATNLATSFFLLVASAFLVGAQVVAAAALDPRLPLITRAAVAPKASATLTLSNQYPHPMSLSFAVGWNTKVNTWFPSIIGATPTTLAASAATVYTMPSAWNGNIAVGQSMHPNNSLIEGNLNEFNALDIDVSYVQGFSGSIICGCSKDKKIVHGCARNLFAYGTCPEDQLHSNGTGCANTVRSDEARDPESFFAPCRHVAFTFPQDAAGNPGSDCWPENDVTCWIGAGEKGSQVAVETEGVKSVVVTKTVVNGAQKTGHVM